MILELEKNERRGSRQEKRDCEDLSDYCGGTYVGLTRHLDYIQDLGFDAIWISPMVQNMEKGYHGYWAKNFSKLNDNFGDEESLRDFVNEAHDRGLLVMLDVVANHMGYGPSGEDFLNVFYPPFKPTSFHDCQGCDPYCSIANYEDPYQLEHCRLVGLPDLNQTDPSVKKFLLEWVAQVVEDFEFDGVRIDAVKHQPREFTFEYARNAGVFSIGEVFSFDVDFLGSYLGTSDSLFSYPMSGMLRGVFGEQQDMRKLSEARESLSSLGFDLSIMGSFLENHDLPRFLSYQPDQSLYINALTYIILGQGIPIIYYGSEQGFDGQDDPDNREPLWTSGFETSGDLYKHIQSLNKIRKEQQLWAYEMTEITISEQCYSFALGDILVVLNNVGQDDPSAQCLVDISKSETFSGLITFYDLLSDKIISVQDDEIKLEIQKGLPYVLKEANGKSRPN
eukprot:TRINITY_DN1381_c3_g2_i1.p1 TRINITY_DN1381_c3_g2~~TRINITY_DN1381_c3_g2_i1.p1  ORF type:complete len:450 (-),score=53.26 TRINITY_DN1381_c3_g2_i1:357-1706(-)